MLKVVLFFNQVNRGWTETWFKDGDDPPLTLPGVDKNICIAAVNFRAPQTTLEWIRYSVVDSPGKVTSFPLVNVAASGYVSTTLPDIVSTDAVYKISGANFARRTIQIRGLTDGAVSRDSLGKPTPSAELRSGINEYLTQVYNQDWRIKQVSTPGNTAGAFKTYRVSRIIPHPTEPNQARVFTNGPVWLLGDPNPRVKFAGRLPDREIPGWPRIAPIYNPTVDGQQFDIFYRTNDNDPYFPENLKATRYGASYKSITTWDFMRFSSRQTGRPFGALRGRRSAEFPRP